MQFIDLHAQYEQLKSEIDAGIAGVLAHSRYIGGPEVQRLEIELAEYLGVQHAITCASGTDALQLIYMAHGIGAGDAVFCPDVTFIASTEPACMLGAEPVFCDITADTFTLDPDSLVRQIEAVRHEGRLTPRAVIAVDMLGNPAEYDRLAEICREYGLLLVEDAAQSFGAEYHGHKCGALGDIAATSFFPAKPLGCYGDGGAVFTNDDEMAALLRSLCVHGKGKAGKYSNERIGLNSRLDTIQAAILLPKLHALRDYEMELRQQTAKRYDDALGDVFQPQQITDGTRSAYAQYALLAKNTVERDAVCAYLTAKGIPNMVYYPKPQHELPVFAHTEQYGETFVNAKDYCARTFSLPMHPYLSAEEQDKVIRAVREAVG